MLTNLKKPVLVREQPTHVDIFVAHYDQLKRWALQFTERDHELAEDLLHDAFIQFTLSKPDLAAIQNLEGYLYIVMRNLHLSQMRKASRTPLRPVRVVEFDTVDMSFWASDPRDRIRMMDELGAICQYACIRKESSKAGSVLILRFFHGYYPEEIGKVFRSHALAVTKRLMAARSEARLFLDDPSRLAFLSDKPSAVDPLNINHSGDDLRFELRRHIFASRLGECLSEENLRNLYKPENSEGISQRTAAHIVSCQICIERVNSMLDLPSLSERYPLDTLGNDPGKKGGSGGTRGGGSAGGGQKMLDSYISRRNAHFHHQPQELCIAVNGQLQSFQKVVAGKGEFTLVVDVDESLGFVEVFSEVGLRLLMLNVEPPPTGDGKQAAHVDLSGGRTLDANLNFSGQLPTLQVNYNDPMLAEDLETQELSAAPNVGSDVVEIFSTVTKARSFERFTDLLRSFMKPAWLTTSFAALLILAVLLYQFAPTTVSAAELLSKSAEQEIAQLANRERVLHRTLDLEEYKDGQLMSRRKIDVWHSAERGVTARRLYDEQGRLVIGDWRGSGGVQTIYIHGQAPKLQPFPEKRGSALLFADAWQLSLSAREFSAFLNTSDSVSLEDRGSEYLITYDKGNSSAENGVGAEIVRASITLSKEDLHATEQAFVLDVNREQREYRMIETAYEWRPVNSVAPAVFEPNVELTGDTALPARTQLPGLQEHSSDTTNTNSNTNVSSAPSAAMATAALEVEVIEALNTANAFMGEQISVSRASDGKIAVTAMVETPQRKQTLLSALASVRNNPAVRLQIETVAEVQTRLARQRGNVAQNPSAVERVEIQESQNQVLSELRQRLSEEDVRGLSNRIVGRSRQARLHALAAKQLAERFSKADLETLTPAERGRWIALVRGHAEKFLAEFEALRRELGPYFSEALSVGPSGIGTIENDKELQSKVRELFQLSGTLQSDLDRSFSANAAASTSPPVKNAAFWRAFGQALGMAKAISAAK